MPVTPGLISKLPTLRAYFDPYRFIKKFDDSQRLKWNGGCRQIRSDPVRVSRKGENRTGSARRAILHWNPGVGYLVTKETFPPRANASKSTKAELWGEPPKSENQWQRGADGSAPRAQGRPGGGLRVPARFTSWGPVTALTKCVPSKPRQGRGRVCFCTASSLLGVWCTEDVTLEALSWRRRDQDPGNQEPPKFTQEQSSQWIGNSNLQLHVGERYNFTFFSPCRFFLFQSVMFS